MSIDTTRPDGTDRGPLIFLSAIAVSLIAVVLGLVWATSHLQRVLDDRRLDRNVQARDACHLRGCVYVERTSGPISTGDPWNRTWNEVEEIELKLQAQKDTMPMLDEVSIPAVRVQGLTDGYRIAWRIRWADATPDANVDSGRFSDAVAVQFPIDRGASHQMGGDGQLVQILHWKALWQKDVDEHFQDVQDLHPNYWTDLYWFASEERPYRVPESFADPVSHQWFAAYSAGNPMADIKRAHVIEELSAEGFGTLTSQNESETVGRGVWKDGEWAVVVSRPLKTEDAMDYQFWAGGPGQLGIAVWDGSASNVGGRKHWSNWVEFEVGL